MPKCRACLSSEQRLVPFDNTSIESYNLLTRLNVKESDGLPQSLCEVCFSTIETFVTFRRSCINSEQILKAEYESSSTNQAATSSFNMEIKLEGKSMDDDDGPSVADDEPFGCEDALQVKDEDMDEDEMEVKEEIKRDGNLTEAMILDLSYLLKIETQSSIAKRGRGRPRKTDKLKSKKPPNVTKTKKKPQKVTKSTEVKQEELVVEKKPTIKRERRSRAKQEKKNPPKVLEWLNCGLCHKKFQSRTNLGAHVETHKGEASCQVCGEQLPWDWEKALSHRYLHIELKRGWMGCHLCWHRFGSRVSFESHYIVNHVLKKTKDLTCLHCAKTYPNRSKLRKHMTTHSEKKFICDYCQKCYNSKSKLGFHINLAHEKKVYSIQCDQCPKRFRFQQHLTTHRSIAHLSERIYCKSCKRHFADEQHLRTHKCGQTLVQCNFCGKLFSKGGLLRRHLVVHTNERPYKCDRCPASFKGKPALKAHINRHDNIRPYHCPQCDSKFFTACVLKKHIAWIHTGERSHVCKVCGKGFAASHNLRVHMKVHGEYLIQSKKDQLAKQD